MHMHCRYVSHVVPDLDYLTFINTHSNYGLTVSIVTYITANNYMRVLWYYLIPSIDISSFLYQNLHHIITTPLSSQ